ncbi:hypothetical protein NF212_10890 [Parasalinivibrio latis]|uniref:hypothetical protein n=1 Tax=Parasalinivibrio latis TaxID=2952610 RepID=UPI0030E218D2
MSLSGKVKKIALLGYFGCLMGLSTETLALSFNDIHKCRALLDFLSENKLRSSISVYPEQDMAKIKDILQKYNKDIQGKYLDPALDEASGGDAGKRKLFEDKISENHQIMVNNLGKRYPDSRIYTEFVLSLNNCVKTVRPSESLKKPLNDISDKMLSMALKK